MPVAKSHDEEHVTSADLEGINDSDSAALIAAIKVQLISDSPKYTRVFFSACGGMRNTISF